MSDSESAASALRVLLTCSAGPVDHPSTWSGTPNNLLAALREVGGIAPVVTRLEEGRLMRGAYRADRLLRLSHSAVRGPAYRTVRGAMVQNAARRLDCAATLHFGTYDLPWLGRGLPAFVYVDTTFDLWQRQATAAAGLPARLRQRFDAFERRALSRATRVFTVGEHVADNVVNHYGVPRERVSAVGTGRGSIRPYSGAKDYRNGRLLTVAKVRPEDKGLPLLLEAFAAARRQRPELTLTVVGGAKYPGIGDHPGVRGTGWIEAEELQSIYEQSSLFVMPARYEPWGLAYIEALSCCTPLLGLAHNALPEISGGGRFGVLTERSDVAGFTEVMLGMLAAPEQLEKMGRAGQAECRGRYSWTGTAGAISQRIVAELARSTRD